jgi:hypothetical protein
MKKETEESTFSGTDALITNKQWKTQECEKCGQCLIKFINNNASKTKYTSARKGISYLILKAKFPGNFLSIKIIPITEATIKVQYIPFKP